MIIAVTILYFLFVLSCLCSAALSYLVWAMQKKIEAQALRIAAMDSEAKVLKEQLDTLAKKVSEGEEVIIKNFEELEVRYLKLQHDFKETKASNRLKAQEVAKAAARIQRARESEQTQSV